MGSLSVPDIPKLDLNKAEQYEDGDSSQLFTIAPEIEGA